MTLLATDNAWMPTSSDELARGLDQVYAKWPRIDRELLHRYGKGLIATTGCPSGEIQTRLRLGQYDLAKQAAAEFRDIFGAENYFLELMDHGNEHRAAHPRGPHAAGQGPRPAAARDQRPALHQPEDDKAQDALLCISPARPCMDPGRFKFDGEGYYLKSPRRCVRLFRELPEACDNTLLIAERCEVSFTEGEGRYMPRSPARPGEDEPVLVRQGGRAGPAPALPRGRAGVCRTQADFEIDVIVSKGYAGYFLVVADFINWAKEQRASGSARAVARVPARCVPTRWGSPTSTRSRTA
jgi:DNA polymerase-3 subunit alpha